MSWPLAIVISIALVVMGVLTFTGADTSDLMLIVVSLLGGMGASELKALKENTNGNVAALMRELTETRKALAAAPPIQATANVGEPITHREDRTDAPS